MTSHVRWVRGHAGVKPDEAVPAGIAADGDTTLYVGRAKHQGVLSGTMMTAILPGSVNVSAGVCEVSWNGLVHRKTDYEMLIADRMEWADSEEGRVPPNAVVGGESETREALFIGRESYEDGSVFVGKVHPSHGVFYMPVSRKGGQAGKEVAKKKYEVLVHV